MCGTGERAFLLLREWRSRIDWLCTNVILPGLVDGWILGDEFQSCQPARPTIYASPRRADLAHSGSDRVYIRHPISPIDLLLTLERLRNGGKQTVVVQHVAVAEGGQAVVAGAVNQGGISK